MICAKCKGNLICGRCKLLESISVAYLPVKNKIEDPTPPSIFIGRIGYPKVFAGPLVVFSGNPELYDNPSSWSGKVEDVLRMRMNVARGVRRINVRSFDEYVLKIQEIAAAKKYFDVEADVKKVVKKPLFDEIVNPAGVSARIENLKLAENPKLPKIVEKFWYDEVKANEAVYRLFEKGFPTHYIQRVFSAGILGVEKKLVPTRWSVTAVHDILGERIKEEVRDFDTINEVNLFFYEHFGNRFVVIVYPSKYFFQLVEIWIEESFWSPERTWIGVDSESIGKKKKYSELSGGYYAARLPVLEYLKEVRRQAGILVVREITPEYRYPLGVWVVEEGVRKAMKSKPLKFESLSQALSYAEELTWNKDWRKMIFRQTSLDRFLRNS